MANSQSPVTLKRSLSLPLLVLYGLGTTIGAGIYALIGEVAGVAGMASPFSFLIAAVIAGFTAFSFAELSARFPKSAGEAYYVQEAAGIQTLSAAIGLMVVFAGVVSSAAISNAFVGYLHEFISLPRVAAIAVIVLLIGLLAAWGIAQSVIVAGILTVVEVGGLALVVWVGGDNLVHLPAALPDMLPGAGGVAWSATLAGAVLAFYAFIGFEDMVNVAEETRNASRILPLAIIVTLVVTTLLYMTISIVSILTVPAQELAAHEAPLVLVYERGSGGSGQFLGLIGIVAILNGALVQVIMASRVLYGLSDQGLLPAILGRVNPLTRTPLVATALVVGLVLILALWFRLAGLAEATASITLAIFTIVNAALIRIRLRDGKPAHSVYYPLIIPILGFVLSLAFLVFGLIG
ncbi:MAG: amino acid permease [Proteobacteria bacterium]|nr:amino acid permease [Pseudomonadota bacterium]MDA1356974.1 amino acid permease [Pseudomonadota bacterium]